MDENDRRLAKSNADLKLLIDSSAYLDLYRIGIGTGLHPLNLLAPYDKIDYFFAEAMARELMQGKEGINPNTVNMLKRSLVDEHAVLNHADKENRFLYDSKEGGVRVATLNTMSNVDYGQILLCQNHKELVLLTDDHRMQKSAAALLDRRLMDVENFLELMAQTPEERIRLPWIAMQKWFKSESGYKKPRTLRFIADREPGELPKHFRE